MYNMQEISIFLVFLSIFLSVPLFVSLSVLDIFMEVENYKMYNMQKISVFLFLSLSLCLCVSIFVYLSLSLSLCLSVAWWEKLRSLRKFCARKNNLVLVQNSLCTYTQWKTAILLDYGRSIQKMACFYVRYQTTFLKFCYQEEELVWSLTTKKMIQWDPKTKLELFQTQLRYTNTIQKS